jgi:predicted nucleotidyltransferase
VLRFASLREMTEYVEGYEEFCAHKARKAERSVNDRRGQHTKDYHARARIYKHEHPELTYRECMQRIKTPPAVV